MDSPDRATAFIETLEAKFAPLLEHPEMGPKRDHLAPELRTHFYRDYVIYYRIGDTEIIIVRVLHGSRDAKVIFGEDEEGE
ncbi:MAG: type II toxin-antitoxin system RelE/ParE family toxin [Proteobacteria bacterium]|nr:type II toxin-antitoxin system RelE/ParE family toxin [Pseudomonadota bacterium]